MGIQDRDWYRDEYRKKANRGAVPTASPDWGQPVPSSPAFPALKVAAYAVLICLAVFGAFSAFRYLAAPVYVPPKFIEVDDKKPENPQSSQQPKPKPKQPKVVYL